MLLFLALIAAQPAPPAQGPPPGGARTFVSPMGEPFRAERGEAPLQHWFRAADTGRDGWLSQAELVRDAERFFATLDTDGSGGIDPDEMKRYEREVAPRDLRLGAAGGRPGGFGEGGPGDGDRRSGRPSGRGGPPDGDGRGMGPPQEGGRGPMGREMPQPVASADADMNRLVTMAEFRTAAIQRFAEKDRNGDGRLVEGELGPDRLPDRRSRRHE